MDWIRIAATGQLQDDEALAVAVGEIRIALYRSEGEYFATENVCTHAFALLSDGFLEDGCIECPLHQARFDIRTGKALCAPATQDVRTYPVKVDGEDILVGLAR
jgi:3-phenylpropionate/trans-cinnamate dioxygenase ferredoxin subunit